MAGSTKRCLSFPGAATRKERKRLAVARERVVDNTDKLKSLEVWGFSSVMLSNTFGELFLNNTLLKLGGGSFGLPEDFTVVGMRREFSQRFLAFSNSGFAVELCDWLAWEFGLNGVKQNFKVSRLGCLRS